MIKLCIHLHSHISILFILTFFLFGPCLTASEKSNNLQKQADVSQTNSYEIHIDKGHPWQPPFELERVGTSLKVFIKQIHPDIALQNSLWLSSQIAGREVKQNKVAFSKEANRSQRIVIDDNVEEVVLLQVLENKSSRKEITKKKVERNILEADAIAKANVITNPIDLGIIFPPSDELLLGPGQTAQINVAVYSRSKQTQTIKVVVWFDETPTSTMTRKIELIQNRRINLTMRNIKAPAGRDRATLNIALLGKTGNRLWHKTIPTILVRQSPSWPKFGATQTSLRYDSPISIRNPTTGTFSTLPYDKGWKPELQDIVVTLPTGGRYVFWKGASYIPFWAGKHNTGLCYEWAEILPPRPENAVDCVEPLMDKELRYGRVKIIESTPARVHVRWTYQSTDLVYNVWGDSAIEDYYFYPDGFATRVVSLKRDPKSQYELSEFIILTAPETYPLNILPRNLIDVLYLDGKKLKLNFPQLPKLNSTEMGSRTAPAVYRVRLHKDETANAIYFTPNENKFPTVLFDPFFDAGELVTPAYWGSHWPLARGNATGSKIDERIHITPCHNSLMSWASKRPIPLNSGLTKTIDSMGRSRNMVLERWAWLIGMTDVDDDRLIEWANSYANPPNLEVKGASIELSSYSMERRALRLSVDQPTVSITIKPTVRCVNPVFELSNAPGNLINTSLNNKVVNSKHYAWDGQTLWLKADIDSPTVLTLNFEK